MKHPRFYFIALLYLLVGLSTASATCPCAIIVCKCCIDRCRVGFIKVPQDGCRDRSQAINFSVVMKVTDKGTDVKAFQGTVSYGLAQTVWNGNTAETAPGIAKAVRELLGYNKASATVQGFVTGAWGIEVGTDNLQRGKPWMVFTPMGLTGANGDGAVTGAPIALDMSTTSVGLQDEPGATTRNLYLNAMQGRLGSGPNPRVSDFVITARNASFYHWYNCTDSFTCTLLFVLAAGLVPIVAVVFEPFIAIIFGGIGGLSLVAQALSWYCAIYPCNKQCTKGTISMTTTYYVRFELLDGGEVATATDVVINNMALSSRVDLVKVGGNYVLASKHYHGPTTKADGSPVNLVFKGTILDLGDSSISGTVESADRQFNLLLVPPQKPSELLPGAAYGIEKRN